jgi:hypothetical protein
MNTPHATPHTTQPTLTVLDHTGDSTYTWNAEQDNQVREIIRAMLADGFVFYVPKRKLLGSTRVVVQDISQVSNTIELVGTAEKDFYQRLFELPTVQRPAGEPMIRSQDPDVISQGGAIARRQAQGG